jgi:hypothetical protein
MTAFVVGDLNSAHAGPLCIVYCAFLGRWECFDFQDRRGIYEVVVECSCKVFDTHV